MCHQTVSLAARHLEENGIATVVMGCAKDIVEFVGVPRFLFSDFPLGNAAGRPKDPQSQALTLELALRLLEAAPSARTTVQSPLRWSEDCSWKLDYSNIRRLSSEEIQRRRQEFDRQKEIARDVRDQPTEPFVKMNGAIRERRNIAIFLFSKSDFSKLILFGIGETDARYIPLNCVIVASGLGRRFRHLARGKT